VRRGAGAASDLAAFGITAGAVPDEIVELSPECEASLRIWVRSGRCWRIGFGGAEGLDLTQIAIVCASMRLSLDEAMLADLQILEDETLAVLDEQRRREDAMKRSR
jgi:hypothetical protein